MPPIKALARSTSTTAASVQWHLHRPERAGGVHTLQHPATQRWETLRHLREQDQPEHGRGRDLELQRHLPDFDSLDGRSPQGALGFGPRPLDLRPLRRRPARRQQGRRHDQRIQSHHGRLCRYTHGRQRQPDRRSGPLGAAFRQTGSGFDPNARYFAAGVGFLAARATISTPTASSAQSRLSRSLPRRSSLAWGWSSSAASATGDRAGVSGAPHREKKGQSTFRNSM